MLILLPPSERKAAGGSGVFAAEALAFPELHHARAEVAHAAGLALEGAPTLQAIERYTGVVYDALDVTGLPDAAREWVGAHVAIGSALFGLVRAHDAIPSYKLSYNTKVPGTSLRALWKPAAPLLETALQEEFVLDLRSKGYAGLLPLPNAVPVEVVDEQGKALAHWNKHSKGALVRAMALNGVRAESPAGLMGWAEDAGWSLRPGDDGLVLTVPRP